MKTNMIIIFTILITVFGVSSNSYAQINLENIVESNDDLKRATFLSNNNLLIGTKKEAMIVNVNTGNAIKAFPSIPNFEIINCAFSEKHNYLLTGRQDGTFQLWDFNSGEELFSYDINGSKMDVGEIGGIGNILFSFSPDNENVAIADITWGAPKVIVFNILKKDISLEINYPEVNSLTDVIFYEFDKLLIDRGSRSSIYEISSKKVVRKFNGATCLSPNKKLLLTHRRESNYGNYFELFDVHTLELLDTFSIENKRLNAGLIFPNGKYIVTTLFSGDAYDQDSIMVIVDLENGTIIKEFGDELPREISTDGHYFMSYRNNDNSIKIYNSSELFTVIPESSIHK